MVSVPNCSILRHHGYPPSIPVPWSNCAIRIGPIPAPKNWNLSILNCLLQQESRDPFVDSLIPHTTICLAPIPAVIRSLHFGIGDRFCPSKDRNLDWNRVCNRSQTGIGSLFRNTNDGSIRHPAGTRTRLWAWGKIAINGGRIQQDQRCISSG
jgi:hypothetical protein